MLRKLFYIAYIAKGIKDISKAIVILVAALVN